MSKDDGVLRSFDTGATRDTADGKLEYHGFLSPSVLRQFARYMNMNRLQSDGQLRSSSNWQHGIPMDVYVSSEWRHHFDFWDEAMKYTKGEKFSRRELMAAASGLMFNVMGFMHEWLKENPEVRFDDDEPTKEMKERQDNIAHETRVEDCRPGKVMIIPGTEFAEDFEIKFDDEAGCHDYCELDVDGNCQEHGQGE